MKGGKTTKRESPSRSSVPWVLPLALAMIGLLLVLHASLYDFVSDDAFIVARYARNVAQGHGWVYNIGERVEGYTSFLWVGMTAVLGLLGIDYVSTVRALSLLCSLLCVPVMYAAAPLLGIERRSPLTCVGPLLLAASGSTACWTLGGLEACGYALAVLAAIVSVADERRSTKQLALAGVVCGLCVLLRPEGIIAAVGLSAWLILVRRRGIGPLLLALWIPFVIITVSHVLWRYLYYGDWLPNTFYVKVGTDLDQLRRGAQYVLAFTVDNGGLAVWATPFAAVWLYPARSFARALSGVGILLVLGVILVGGDGLPMYRFMVPIVPLWALLVEAMLADIMEHGRSVEFGRLSRGRLAIPALVVVCLVIPLMSNPQHSGQYSLYSYQQSIEVPRWTAAGKWLAANAPPFASLACVPIGAVGYYSELHVYDMMGLTDRHIARKPIDLGKGWSGHEKHDGPYILSKSPTYLLLGNIQVIEQKLPTDSPYFVRPPAPAIRRRENDIFVPELGRDYVPEVAELGDGLYFHFLRRKATGQ